MIMVFKEIKKLKKTNIIKTAFFLNLLLLIFYVLKGFNKTNAFDFYFNVILDMSNVVFFYNILSYVILSEIISNESSKGLIDYLRIKSKQDNFVILSKIMATLFYVCLFLIMNIAFVLVISLIFKSVLPYEIKDNVSNLIWQDPDVISSVKRMLLLNINVFFGIFISTLICGVIAVISNNKIATIISSFISVMFLTYPINIKGKTYSLIWYKLALLNLDLSIKDYTIYIIKNSISYILIGIVLYKITILLWRRKNNV